jgi:acyl transferase domain-containing protein
MAARESEGLSSPVGSVPTTASLSETIDDQSGTYSPGHWDSSSSNGTLPEVAICGIGLRLPGGIRDCKDYWDLLENGRDARGPIPPSRYNIDGFDDGLGGKDGIRVKHGYFLDEELSALDTSFFTLTKNELEKTDPQQRMLLEVTRECLEDAAEVNYRGQLIGCYVGTFGDDWLLMSAKETAQAGGYMVTGHGDLMMANRVSYEYDFRGPRWDIRRVHFSSYRN